MLERLLVQQLKARVTYSQKLNAEYLHSIWGKIYFPVEFFAV
jgi:hypothetical protein